MAVVVNWAAKSKVVDQNNLAVIVPDPALELVFSPPEPFYAYLKTKRKESSYLKCYALLEYFKNSFVIKAPFDLKIKFDRTSGWLSVSGISQAHYDTFVSNRLGEYATDDPPLVSMTPSYIFYSDTSVEMTYLPIPLIGDIPNTRLIPGKFNIAKWIRPIDWTFEIVDEAQEIVVYRDDPLFLVAFETLNNQKVTLNRVPMSDDLLTASAACVSLKTKIKNIPLKKCYELAESFLAMWRKYRKD